jgi:anti-sigma B factor antagonist
MADNADTANTTDTTITHEDLGEDLRKIIIVGRLDTPGTDAIAPSLHELAAGPMRAVIVDLTNVQFAASIGIGKLIATAKEVKSRGGHMVLLVTGGSGVARTMEMGAIDRIIPTFQYLHEAHAGALRGY